MKRILTICLVLVSLVITGKSVFATIPHPVYVSVDNIDGLIPSNGDVLFNAWLTVRPTEIGNQDSFDWGYGVAPGAISVNCGNVFSTWTAGDVLHIEAQQISTGYTGIGEYTLNYDNYQMFSGDQGITLVPEPATICLLGLGAIAMRRRRA